MSYISNNVIEQSEVVSIFEISGLEDLVDCGDYFEAYFSSPRMYVDFGMYKNFVSSYSEDITRVLSGAKYVYAGSFEVFEGKVECFVPSYTELFEKFSNVCSSHYVGHTTVEIAGFSKISYKEPSSGGGENDVF